MKFELPMFLSTMWIYWSLSEPTLWAKAHRACAKPIAHRGGLLQKNDPLHVVQANNAPASSYQNISAAS